MARDSLLLLTPVVQGLRRLAQGLVENVDRSLGMDAGDLALELYHFLEIKRQLAFSTAAGAMQVSPGYMVDALWHRMLLESEVGAVEEGAITVLLSLSCQGI